MTFDLPNNVYAIESIEKIQQKLFLLKKIKFFILNRSLDHLKMVAIENIPQIYVHF
jgi:hypothetical protein